MRGIMSDRDMMQLCLDQAKHAASNLTAFIMECSYPSLRQECLNLLNTVLQEQHSCYELMHQRGWYQPMPADANAMTAAQQALNTMLAQTGSTAGGMGMGMAMPPGSNPGAQLNSYMGGAMGSSMGGAMGGAMGSPMSGMGYGHMGAVTGLGHSTGMASSHTLGTSQTSLGTTQSAPGTSQPQ